MSFFKSPAAPPEPPRRPVVPWDGPPANVLGAAVPVDLVIASSEQAVVTVGALTAYSTGFEFEYIVRVREEKFGELLPETHRWHRRVGDGEELPDELFRFGIEFADGSRVTTLESRPPSDLAAEDARGPAMVPRGGGGSFERWVGQWWVWPLPPGGLMAFVCEWPAAGIGLTCVEFDASRLREAATRARILWEGDAAASPGAGYSVSQTVSRMMSFQPEPPAV